MLAQGRGAWWNGRGDADILGCVARAEQAQLDFVIGKASFTYAIRKFVEAGFKVGVERYAYPDQPGLEAYYLRDGLENGARFVVINAEAEWEVTDGLDMRQLCQGVRDGYPNVEIYASVDTRGDRTHLPYQQVLREYATAIMPMVYPKSFYPSQPFGYVSQSFADCLDTGQEFGGLPLLPTLQTYDDIGSFAVEEEIEECKRRGFLGWQAYTIAHASEEEWGVFSQIGRPLSLQERLARLERLLAGNGIRIGADTDLLGGEEALRIADNLGISVYGGLLLTQRDIEAIRQHLRKVP